MKNHHRYFRNKNWKKRMTNKYYNSHYNGKYLVYISKEESTNDNISRFYRTGPSRWEYYEIPDVPYKVVLKYAFKKGNSSKKYFRGYCNKKFRKNKQKWLTFSERSMYRKVNEYWWNID